ncbi:hypothetical protein BDW69DRAFT_192009 [Aspergillus filifer]
MSFPGDCDELADGEQDNIGVGLEVTFHYAADCLDPDEPYFGLILYRNPDGDILPGSSTHTFFEQDPVLESATAARRRRRIPPERPPRSPQPIQTWEELAQSSWVSPRERERHAAEIVSRPELDDEPDPSTWPNKWSTYHDYFLWTCRGTVEIITDHLQAVFRFKPPIEETFVAARLGGINAYKQMTFLRKYVPGEVHTLQRAEARAVIYEADISHPDVRWGTHEIDMKQPNYGSPEYVEPILPCWAPSEWSRADDAFAAMYLGKDPVLFRREYGWAFAETPSIEFIGIRMAQIPHLNLTWMELQAAKSRHDFLQDHPSSNMSTL